MILTVTMNPSIDTRYEVDHLVIDDVNRVTPHKTAGGKGLNVSRVLVQLGDDVLATGLLGGHSGAYLGNLMDEDHIPHRFTPIAGESRTCIALLHDGNQTELLESGPAVSAEELEAFLANYVPSTCYAQMVAAAVAAGKPVLLDTSGAALDAALDAASKPTLVKPNLTEINALLGTAFTTEQADELGDAVAADARFQGIPWVVVTMGAAGAVAFHEGHRYRVTTPAIEAVNATGSGDSTVAGFAHAIAQGADDETVLRCGNTCGKLNAMDPQTGHLAMEHWDEVYNGITVTRL